MLTLSAACRTLLELDVIQEAPGLSRGQQQATGEPGRWSKAGRSLKDVRHGLPTGPELPKVDSMETAAAKEASFDREVGRVLLQWGQSSEGLQEMLLQVRANRHSCCIVYMTGPLLLPFSEHSRSVCSSEIRKMIGKFLCNMKLVMIFLLLSVLSCLAGRERRLCCCYCKQL